MTAKPGKHSQADPPGLLDLYRIALDEYRFQVNLNWQRTQHWFTLNAAISGAAIALLKITSDTATYVLVAAIFVCGAFAAFMAVVSSLSQKAYYQSIRDHKRKIEDALELGDLAIKTTVGMGNPRRLRVKVTTLYLVLLVMLGAVDLVGFGYSIHEATGASARKATLAAAVPNPPGTKGGCPKQVIASQSIYDALAAARHLFIDGKTITAQGVTRKLTARNTPIHAIVSLAPQPKPVAGAAALKKIAVRRPGRLCQLGRRDLLRRGSDGERGCCSGFRRKDTGRVASLLTTAWLG